MIILTNERDAPLPDKQPKVQLGPWRVFRSVTGDLHICGELTPGRLRFTSALTGMDFSAGVAVTSSGREYAFQTPPARDADVQTMIEAMAVNCGLSIAVDVSDLWWTSILHGPDTLSDSDLAMILCPPRIPPTACG